jgi:outer membrane lipoprotein SlyB
VAGGLLGAAAEQGMTRQEGVEITVRLDNGELRAIVQTADEPFKPGDRVRLLSVNGQTRVSK